MCQLAVLRETGRCELVGMIAALGCVKEKGVLLASLCLLACGWSSAGFSPSRRHSGNLTSRPRQQFPLQSELLLLAAFRSSALVSVSGTQQLQCSACFPACIIGGVFFCFLQEKLM